MYKKIALVLMAGFIFFYFFVYSMMNMFIKHEEKLEIEECKMVQENVKSRFRLFLEPPLAIGLIGADYFSKGDLTSKNYGPLANELLNQNQQILGLNIVDEEGRIIRGFPEENIVSALGKISQNFPFFKHSYDQKEPYWFSPPFELYQGGKGFAFYIPIKDQNGLKGWFAPVIKTENFFNSFRLAEFMNSYDVIIKDELTNSPYFATAQIPADKKFQEERSNIKGRDLVIQTWKKKSAFHPTSLWPWCFFAAAFLAIGVAYMVKLSEQKKSAHQQLDEISLLLRLTSKELLSNLIDSHSKDEVQHTAYLTSLIEQIDLLQTMAHTGGDLLSEKASFIELLENQLKSLGEIISKKNLKVEYERENLMDIYLGVNSWLLQNSVINNILSHAIIHAKPDSIISVDHTQSSTSHVISFKAKNIQLIGPESGALKLDRRMEVARRIIEMYKGQLSVQNDLSDGMIIRITLPA